MAMLYNASRGSPGGGLDAKMKACVAMYPASGVLGTSKVALANARTSSLLIFKSSAL
jgi:hypothetical protein